MKFSGRQIIFYKDYFNKFYLAQTIKVQEKIEYVLRIVKQVEHIPKQYFRHIEDSNGIFEIRIEYASNIFRIFCCFDEHNIVVLFNGFQKKTQKTPKEQIVLADKLKKEYFKMKTQLK